MTYEIPNLADLGWTNFFTSQLEAEDLESGTPARVMQVHRSHIVAAAPDLEIDLNPHQFDGDAPELSATVGDWLLLDAETGKPIRLLQRKSLFKRRAPGTARKVQLIAANIDTLFVVSSCNQDFNPARLERYLALAHEENVTPVIVLTKADLAGNPEAYAEAARLMPDLLVEVMDARNPQSARTLTPWCARGQTVAFVGSSGVGKSTLINTLTGHASISTQGIREDDSKGRHTTTARALHRLPAGGWLLDTPGMRELQLTDVRSGLKEVFADIEAIAQHCRFADCQHDQEPGCAVRAALESGELAPKRLSNWQKLKAEEAYNSETLAERRNRQKSFGKMVKNAMGHKRKNRRQ